MKNKKQRKRNVYVIAARIGCRLGMIALTGYFTFRILRFAYEAWETRVKTVGGECCIVPLIILLFWAGWTARKEYTYLKAEQHERKEATPSRRQPLTHLYHTAETQKGQSPKGETLK